MWCGELETVTSAQVSPAQHPGDMAAGESRDDDP